MSSTNDRALVNTQGTEKSILTVHVESRTKKQVRKLSYLSGLSMTDLVQVALDELIAKYTSIEIEETTNEER